MAAERVARVSPGSKTTVLTGSTASAVTAAEFSTTALICIAARLRSIGVAGTWSWSGDEHDEHHGSGDYPEVPHKPDERGSRSLPPQLCRDTDFARGERCPAPRVTAGPYQNRVGPVKVSEVSDSPPPVLATVWRGTVVEARIRGHVAVVDAPGKVLELHRLSGRRDDAAQLRQADCRRFRSSVSPPTGWSVGDAEIAIACASHQGEDEHLATVRRLLAKAQVPEEALGVRAAAARRTRRRRAACSPRAGRHNRSTTTALESTPRCWPRARSWVGRSTATWSRRTRVSRRSAPRCRRCSASISRLPRAVSTDAASPRTEPRSSAIAGGFAAAGADPAFRRAQDAMAAHPFLVAGTNRFDTALLEVAGGRLTAKIGGAGSVGRRSRAPTARASPSRSKRAQRRRFPSSRSQPSSNSGCSTPIFQTSSAHLRE